MSDEIQLFPLKQALGIEATSPFWIIPAGNADADHDTKTSVSASRRLSLCRTGIALTGIGILCIFLTAPFLVIAIRVFFMPCRK